MIPFLDLRAAYIELEAEINSAIKRVLDSGQYIGGGEVAHFEAEFATYCEVPYCVGVANGLDALTLALRALGVGPGNEVIVPSNTYIATWLAVSAVGAVPVPVEPDPATHNINPNLIEPAISDRTRAIIPVHLYGQPVDIDAVLSIAGKYGLSVIEDAAQSHGAKYKGKRIGGHSHVVCWSFYPGKNLGALGDAGAVTTHDPIIADRVRMLGNYGSKQKYINELSGVNSRIDPVQAAILRVKLSFLDQWNERRCAVASHYMQDLSHAGLVLPLVLPDVEPVWHLFVVRSSQRDKLQAELADAGIGTLIHYPVPPHMQLAFKQLQFIPSDLPVAQYLASEVLSLPIGPHLGMDRARIVSSLVNKFCTVL